MLRRLTVGLFVLACAAAFAACSSSDINAPSSGGVTGLGPNFSTNTVYVANTTQNSIELYTPNPGPSATPQYLIGGSNTALNGPLYLAFDGSKRLYVTNYNSSTQAAVVDVYAEYATGSVLPLTQITDGSIVQPRGIAVLSDGTVVIANTTPTGTINSNVLIFSALGTGTSSALDGAIGGTQTGLNQPVGVSSDSNKDIFVANRGNGTITAYAVPTPTPSPSTTSSPTPSPSPSSSPAPTPTPFYSNVAPIVTIGGAATGLVAPTGLTLDATNTIYVADPDSGTPSIRVFAAGSNGNVAPSRVIAGPLTGLANPVDVKVDAGGTIYVTDAGVNKLLIFAPGANGNVAPSASIALPAGTVGGMALSP